MMIARSQHNGLVAEIRRVWRPGRPVDADATLGALARGRHDPVARRLAAHDWFLTGRTPQGPGSMRLAVRAELAEVRCAAWGPGAQWLLESAPVLLGEQDDPTGFRPVHDVLAEAWRRHGAGWRVPRTGLMAESVIPAVLEQRVTGKESRHAWRSLCRDHGEVAPGPTPRGMWLVPDWERLRQVPSWWWRRHGVDAARSKTLIRVARAADSIEACAEIPVTVARHRLAAIPGIGVWTVAEVASRALGDADAVSVGDFHLAAAVVFTLTGRRGGTDLEMLELLAPYRGHRQRAQRLVEVAGSHQPRRGPRATIPTHWRG